MVMRWKKSRTTYLPFIKVIINRRGRSVSKEATGDNGDILLFFWDVRRGAPFHSSCVGFVMILKRFPTVRWSRRRAWFSGKLISVLAGRWMWYFSIVSDTQRTRRRST